MDIKNVRMYKFLSAHACLHHRASQITESAIKCEDANMNANARALYAFHNNLLMHQSIQAQNRLANIYKCK